MKTTQSIKKQILLAAMLAASLALSSCDKTPLGDGLDGMWQLMSEETADTTINRKSDKIFVCFRRELAQFDAHGNEQLYFAYYTHRADSISFSNFCFRSANAVVGDDNVALTEDDVPLLREWGIYSLQPAFRVLSLGESTMIWQSETALLKFRKF